VERATASSVVAMAIVHGGDTAAAYRVDLNGGRRLFAKTHPSPPPGFFTTEAASLRWLRAAGAVPIPEVIAVSDGDDGRLRDGGTACDGDTDSGGSGGDDDMIPAHLVLEWIEHGRSTGATEAGFGSALAMLHDCGAPSFGREDRRTTGGLALPNDPQDTWSEFYAACRLMPLARLAADRRALEPPTVAALERLSATLDRFDDGSSPARLHGDLWAGNRVVDTAGRSWLIDPAAHGGHIEFDLAMMRLFGGFSADVFHSYEDHHPLAVGWQDRVSLHQIAPLVVHAIKFGGGYMQAATAAIARY